jgi:hypothetical protein
MKAKKVLSTYGNMTNVEKQMNKEDLQAWKVYDNNQYALIPGINHTKPMVMNGSTTPLRGRSSDSYEYKKPSTITDSH